MTALQASIFGILLITASTFFGSSAVFFVKSEMSNKFKTIILGLGAGIMLSCALFGLTSESIEYSFADSEGIFAIIPIGVGFTLGILTLVGFGYLSKRIKRKENSSLSIHGEKMFFAVASHNIPEGLGVGFVCGAAFISESSTAIFAVISISIALAIHNLVQGITISLSMYGEGTKKQTAFTYMAITGIIEAIFAVIGIFIANSLENLMPWLLAFAGGAMTYIAIEDLYPEALEGGEHNLAVLSFFVAFVIMMMFELYFE
ncbi:MAG: ZIP family metal transporter [Bacilli bacterium]